MAERTADQSPLFSIISTLEERRRARLAETTPDGSSQRSSDAVSGSPSPVSRSGKGRRKSTKSESPSAPDLFGGKDWQTGVTDPQKKPAPSPKNKRGKRRKPTANLPIFNDVISPAQTEENFAKNQVHTPSFKSDLISEQLEQNPSNAPLPRQIRRVRKKRLSPLIYLTRILILGVGLAVISGTVLSFLQNIAQSVRPDPAISSAQSGMASQENNGQPVATTSGLIPVPLPLPLNQELTTLKDKITNALAEQSNLTTGVFVLDVDTGNYLEISGEQVSAAASTIKVPILVALFQAVDEGRIKLDEMLTMEKNQVAKGSGDMQDRKPGTKFSVLTTAIKMITISDNTATNMLIDRLGGMEVLNQQFSSWGLKDTVLNNKLPDLEGTNTTTAKDLVSLLSQINQGGLVSIRSRDRIFRIMSQTENNSLLPQGLPNNAAIAHKTGTINSLLADVGIIDLPSGQRYIIAVIVKYSGRSRNAEKAIKDISKLTYDYLANSN